MVDITQKKNPTIPMVLINPFEGICVPLVVSLSLNILPDRVAGRKVHRKGEF